MGPLVATVPPSVRLQEPLIVSVDVSGVTLRTEGGNVVLVRGVQLGAAGSLVQLLLTRSVLTGPGSAGAATQTLTSPPCTVVVPTTLVQCGSPVGTGTGYFVAVMVDGIQSDPWANGTVSYSAPLVRAVDVHRQWRGGLQIVARVWVL
jgi:hypothetical protein